MLELGIAGMTFTCDMRLTSFGPVDAALMTMYCYSDGWTLSVRHRHLGGLFTDCPRDDYDRLTLGELQDVLCAVSSCWGPLGAATDAL